ncbi:MAG TPA: PLDc N-terminal domain-containing protein [Anaerolineaceae bacterium]|jgi:hypothetical protein|nr:PLDc N-terminal domain-containing protein [Anaerolineaceae bacterium]
MDSLALLKEWLPLLIPVVILELGLMIAALVDLIKREKTKGPKWVWVLVIVLVNLFGPIVYFLVGRDE